MIHYSKKFVALTARQRRAFFVALWQLTWVTAQLRFRSINWFWAKTRDDGVNRAGANLAALDHRAALMLAKEYYESIRLAARCLPFSCECVPRSIVLRDILQQAGVSAQVKIGVKKSDRLLNSHAWVEVLGEAIGEKAGVQQRFTAMPQPPVRKP